MKNILNVKTIVSLPVALAIAVLSLPASAATTVFVNNLKTLESNTGTTASNTGAISSTNRGILSILQTNFGVSGTGFTNQEIVKVGEKVVAQSKLLATLADLQAENDVLRAKREQAVYINRNVRLSEKALTDLCIEATAAQHGDAAEETRQGRRSEIESKAATKAKGAVSTSTSKAERVVESAARYCDVVDAELGRCESAAISSTPNADVKAASLFVGAPHVEESVEFIRREDNGKVIGIANITSTPVGPGERRTYTEDDVLAALDYSTNVVYPLPDRMADIDVNNSPEFINYETMLNARQARLAMAYSPYAKLIADREPAFPVSEWKAQIDSDMASGQLGAGSGDSLLGFDGIDQNMLVDGKMSWADKLHYDVKRRYQSLAWYRSQSGSTPEQRDFERMNMTALSLKLQYETLLATQETQALLGAILANQLTPVTQRDLENAYPVNR